MSSCHIRFRDNSELNFSNLSEADTRGILDTFASAVPGAHIRVAIAQKQLVLNTAHVIYVSVF